MLHYAGDLADPNRLAGSGRRPEGLGNRKVSQPDKATAFRRRDRPEFFLRPSHMAVAQHLFHLFPSECMSGPVTISRTPVSDENLPGNELDIQQLPALILRDGG